VLPPFSKVITMKGVISVCPIWIRECNIPCEVLYPFQLLIKLPKIMLMGTDLHIVQAMCCENVLFLCWIWSKHGRIICSFHCCGRASCKLGGYLCKIFLSHEAAWTWEVCMPRSAPTVCTCLLAIERSNHDTGVEHPVYQIAAHK
jgi:hypothetical protein